MAEDLATLWHEQQNAQFPPTCIETKFEGTTLLLLDASMGSILTRCLQRHGTPGPLSPDEKKELGGHAGVLSRALEQLELDDPGKKYFTRLLAITQKVLHG